MKHIKLIATNFAAITLLSVTIPSVTSVALAAEGLTEHQEIDSFRGLSDQELNDLGFSYIEIASYHDNMTNPVYIENGMILNSKTQQVQRGKFTWAVKIIRAGYDKLPLSVKKFIAAYMGLETLLSFIENATGTIQDAVYQACRDVGMSHSVANIVTAAIMTLVF